MKFSSVFTSRIIFSFVIFSFTSALALEIKQSDAVVAPEAQEDGLSEALNNAVKKEVLEIKKVTTKKKSKKDDNPDKIQFKTDNLTVNIGGKVNNETFFANNMNFLNADVANDSTAFVRTTFDLWSMLSQGNEDEPRLMFYDTLRFRFKWGSVTDVKSDASSVTISNTKFDVKGTATNKHLLWMRESWLKVRLGEINEHNNYVQIGLIPYQVGRGISLGAAYDALGFLGFAPGSSIDQYAPAVLFSFNPVSERFVFDIYFALLENKQTSLSETEEIVRTGELGQACGKRGVGRQSFLTALRSDIHIWDQYDNRVDFEPYIVIQHAPDQDLEFSNDDDSYLTTTGASIEGNFGKVSWGIEGARNFGQLDVKPWDRNKTKVVRNSDGILIEQYTKVYTSDPATTLKPTSATITSQAATIVAASPKNRFENGKLIGTIAGSPSIDLYNAFDRFRPAQTRHASGYFFVADATYDFVPKIFNASLGVGYASGFIDEQQDVNKLTDAQLLNEQFTAFIPLQSVYSGKRLRHLVLFNQGVPRFNVRLPNENLFNVNTTSVLQPDAVNEMTNIAFIGTRFDWKVQALKKHGVNIVQNIIAYWSPETAHFPTATKTVQLNDSESVVVTTASEQSDNFIGTEFTVEFSALFYEKWKMAGYFGLLLPGKHYKDMSGTLIKKYNEVTGCDVGYVGNIGIAYFF